MTTTPPTHDQERQAILKEYPLTYFIAAAALFIVLGIAIGALLFGQNSPLADADNNYFSNVYLTIISTAFTVIVIDHLNRRRDLRQLQDQLVHDAGSISNEVARNAIYQLKKRNWLEGDQSLLKGAGLRAANLQHTKLNWANLENVNLFDANLRDADMGVTNLENADLRVADLQGANLGFSNLRGTRLESANLQGVSLFGANLQNANLWGVNLYDADLFDANLWGAFLGDANLQDVNLQGAKLYESTILPDCNPWTPDTDMTRFTDPNHPNFWRSDDTQSPAYRGADAAPTAAPPPKP